MLAVAGGGGSITIATSTTGAVSATGGNCAVATCASGGTINIWNSNLGANMVSAASGSYVTSPAIFAAGGVINVSSNSITGAVSANSNGSGGGSSRC